MFRINNQQQVSDPLPRTGASLGELDSGRQQVSRLAGRYSPSTNEVVLTNLAPPECDNFYERTVVATFDAFLPSQGTLPANVINYLTGVYDFLDTTRAELCASGIKEASARAAISAFGRSTGSLVAASAGAVATGIGAVTAGPVGAAAGLAIGGSLLVALPPLFDRLGNKAVDIAQFFLDKIRVNRPLTPPNPVR